MKSSNYKVGKIINTPNGKAKVEGVSVINGHCTVSYRFLKKLANSSETGTLSFPDKK